MDDLSALVFGGVSSNVIFYVIVAVMAVIFLFFLALGLNVLAMRMMMKGMSTQPRRRAAPPQPVEAETVPPQQPPAQHPPQPIT
jgi:hypothetical protein